MNNLKPNMYIRTKEGKIDKIVEINTEDFEEPTVRLASYPIGMYQGMFKYKKASHKPIELIEEGDYVNGMKVNNIAVEDGLIFLHMDADDCLHEDTMLTGDDIRSIVTKEQFKIISYEVIE